MVLEVATVFPLSFLFVLFHSMRKDLRKMKEDRADIDTLDCIFFYRSWTAIPVSIIWLMLPVALLAGQYEALFKRLDSAPSTVAFLFTWLLPIPALSSLYQGCRTRWLYLAPYPSDESAEPKPGIAAKLKRRLKRDRKVE